MTTDVATKTLDGVEIPTSGVWEIDPSHSEVGFSVRHLMVAKVRGRFGSFEGSFEVSDDLERSSAQVTIDASSIDTREERRDAHLRSADFFDAENYPTIVFRSTGFRRTGRRTFELDGELTIRDQTRPVTLSATYHGLASDPWGGTRVAFTASTEIDRELWGLSWNQALETGGVVVGRKVAIELEVEAVRKQEI